MTTTWSCDSDTTGTTRNCLWRQTSKIRHLATTSKHFQMDQVVRLTRPIKRDNQTRLKNPNLTTCEIFHKDKFTQMKMPIKRPGPIHHIIHQLKICYGICQRRILLDRKALKS